MNPFEFIKILHNKKYKWDDLTEEDQKSFNIYIVNKGLSMNPNYIPIVNLFQKYTSDSHYESKDVYNFYYNALPSKFKFFKWIKNKKDKLNPDLKEKLIEYYKIPEKEVDDYIGLLGVEGIIQILEEFGLDYKEIKKLMK